MIGSDTELTLSIGAVSRATGVPANTLRTWERRYGFPNPVRTEGGQRVYPAAIIPHLVEVARAIEEGFRPRDVLTSSREQLAQWAVPVLPAPSESELLDAVRALDAVSLRQQLRMLWALRGGVACLDDVIRPLIEEVEQERRAGQLGTYQHRFASETLRGFLGEQWRPLADSARGSVVVCAGLDEAADPLGLHFAATTLALCGRKICFLGSGIPVVELLAACTSPMVKACAVAVPEEQEREATLRSLRELEAGLGERVSLLLGGPGAVDVDVGVQMVSCSNLCGWAKTHP